MADYILLNMYINQLGLTGKAADEMRQKLEKTNISDDELKRLISGKETATQNDTKGFETLKGNKLYTGEAFFNYKPTTNGTVFKESKEAKKYNTKEEKELRDFASNYLYDSANSAVKLQKDYHDSIGTISADAVVQGSINIGDWVWDSLTGRNDYQTLAEQEKMLEKELNSAKKIKNSTQKGTFEFNFEKERKVPYNPQAIEDLKIKSEEYTKITAYQDKYTQLENGLKEVKTIINTETEYKNALKNTRGTARAGLTVPEVSSHEKFGEVLLDFCNGDKELVSRYMAELTTKMGSKEEIEKNYPKILEELQQNCKKDFEKQLKGKTFEQYTKDYNGAYKKAFGGENVEKLTQSYIEAQKTSAGYAEIGTTIAISLMIPGSSAVSKGAAKLAGTVGEQAAGQIIKGSMTAAMASTPAAITTIGAFTSKSGFTEEKKTEALEKWKSGLMYGGFGAYASGPLGNAVESLIKSNPNLITKVVSSAFNNSAKATTIAAKTVGITAETSTDVMFDMLTNDLDIKTSLELNGAMNIGMMVAGGRLSKMHKGVEGLKIEKTEGNTFNVKNPDGKLVFSTSDENVLATFVMSNKLGSNENDMGLLKASESSNLTKADNIKGKSVNSVNKIEEPNITPEERIWINRNAKKMCENAKRKEKSTIDFLEKYELGKDGAGMVHRVKGEQGLYDKIERLIKEGKTFDDAVKGVFDSVGARTIAKKIDIKDYPELLELYKKDPKKAIECAAEIQSQPMVDKIKKILVDYKTGESDTKIKTVSNYVGDDGVPYFSEKQMNELLKFAAENEIKDFTVVDLTKHLGSGYTAMQMNFENKDGFVFEWQYRGEEINRFAESEHIPYDLRQGKDITGGHKNLEELFKPIDGIAKGLSKEDNKLYNQYLTEHYNYLRKKELGFEGSPPLLDKKFDRRLSAENLEYLSDISFKVKKGELSEKEALGLYKKKTE